MGYRLGDFWIERNLFGVYFDKEGNIQYMLTQISDATIDITASTEDVTDKDGIVVGKRFTGKTGTFTANNAMMNVNILASQTGSAIERAIQSQVIAMPSMVIAKAGESVVLTDISTDDVPQVLEVWGNGATGNKVNQNTTASATEFGYEKASKKITLPTPTGENAPTKYLIKYQRDEKDGLKISNYADKFPPKGQFIIKVLIQDPCGDGKTFKVGYIDLPNFQPSADASVATAADTKMEYKGDILPDYCSDDKAMYHIYFPNETVEGTSTK